MNNRGIPRSPTFLVVGAQKSATTWLYECLREHPDVYVPKTKEIHFFCGENDCPKSTASHGEDWYRSQFSTQDCYKAAGELSIDYMFYEDVAEKVSTFNPQMKIIFLLRDPIDRAYSAYWMEKRYKADHPDFTTFVHQESPYVARGFYYRQIMRYLGVFPRENIAIYLYDDLLKDPRQFTADVFDFLGVASEFVPSSLNQRVAQTRKMAPLLSRILYTHVAPVLRWAPALWLWRMIKRHTNLTSRGGALSAEHSAYPPMREEDKADLLDIYREENQKLFQLLGREITDWQK